MAASDFLLLLQQGFPQGQTTGQLILSDLNNPAYETLFTQMGIADTPLALTSTDGWQISGNDVVFSGSITLVPASGDGTTVFGLAEVPVFFDFSPDGDSGNFILLMALTLPSSWTFVSSFPVFQDTLVNQVQLSTAQNSALVISSGQASYQPGTTLPVLSTNTTPGLYFYGFIDIAHSGQLSLLSAFTGNTAAVQPVNGALGYDNTSGIVTMNLELAGMQILNAFGTTTTFSFGLYLSSGITEGLNLFEAGIAFIATLGNTTTSNPPTLTALLTDPTLGIIDFSITNLSYDFTDATSLFDDIGGNSSTLTNSMPPAISDTTSTGVTLSVGFGFGISIATPNLQYVWISIDVTLNSPWILLTDPANDNEPLISLTDVGLTFTVLGPLDPDTSYDFRLTSNFTLATLDVQLAAELDVQESVDGPTQDIFSLEGTLLESNSSNVGDFVAAFLPSTSSDAITLLNELEFAELDFFGVIGPGSAGNYGGDLAIAGDMMIPFGVNNTFVLEEVALSIAYSTTAGFSGKIIGKFSIDANDFDVELELGSGTVMFSATWTEEGPPLTFQDIAIGLGIYNIPNLPSIINLGLESASFKYTHASATTAPPNGTDVISFTIKTTFGSGTLVAGKDVNGNWGYICGMIAGLDISLNLANIPVIGQLIPSGDDILSLNNLRIVAATQNLPVFTPDALQVPIFGGAISSGLALSIDFSAGNLIQETITARFGGLDDGTAADIPPNVPGAPTNGGTTATNAAPATPLPQTGPLPPTTQPGQTISWLNVQRAFGPLQVNRVGFALTADDQLAVYLDTAVSFAGLTITLTDLEAAIPTSSPFYPTFSLSGLEVAYTSGSLSIAGGLAATTAPGVPTIYTGNLSIIFGTFGVTALGSYTTINEPPFGNQPSLFAYLYASFPIGGPPAFFITGLAGGFGYNQLLSLPTITTVSTYPLVAAAMNQMSSAATQQALTTTLITPTVNEEWLAAGIRFTSYGLLNSFAMVSVAFGSQFQLGVMGESTLSIPPPADSDNTPPIAQGVLTLLAEFIPSQGILSFQAQLTPQSYIFSKSALLTGGFAFFYWFGDNAHAGDFVVSLGGYNPYYVPNSWYPTVPRLGLSWTLSTELSISGGLYFAITPAVIMAGGTLNANWQSGNLKAWFSVEADFLIRFKPFHFFVGFSVTVGASYKITFIITKTITIQVGMALQLWGPSFGGSAHVDLSILSFTISFGAANNDPVTPDWPTFSQSFLPPTSIQNTGTTSSLAEQNTAEDTSTTTTNSLLTISASSGLISSSDSSNIIVDPSTLQFTIGTQIPTKEASLITAVTTTPTGSWDTDFGIGPMGVAASSVDVQLSVTIQRNSANDKQIWQSSAITGSLPKGLWLSVTNSMPTDGTLDDLLVGMLVWPVLPSPDYTLPIPLSLLVYDESAPNKSWTWATPTVPTTDTFDQNTAMQTMQQTIVDGNATSRNYFIASLNAQGFSLTDPGDLSDFANDAPQLLVSTPSLRLTGESQP